MGLAMLVGTVEGSPFYGISDIGAGTLGLLTTLVVGLVLLAFTPTKMPEDSD